MNKNSKDITTTIIATIISLIAITTFVGSFISNQSKIATQLANIQVQVAEISTKLDKRDEEIKNLTNRIIILETKNKEE